MLNRLKATLVARGTMAPPDDAVPSVPEQPLSSPESIALAEPAPAPSLVLSDEPPDFVVPRTGIPLERSFCQLGFTAIPQVFTSDEIAQFRRAAVELFPANRSPYTPHFSSTVLFAEPFRAVFRNAKFIGALRRLLGDDFLFVNELGMQDSNFSGWHTDTSSPEGKAGRDFHWSPGFMVLNAAIYFQDNRDNGGGLDVVPGSYVHDDPVALAIRREKGFPASHFLPEDTGDPYRDAVTIRAKAGDVVIFHLRTKHRSSVPSRPARDDDERKFALFLIAGSNNVHTRRYRTWLDEYDGINGSKRAVIDDFRSYLTTLGLTII